MYFTPGNHFKLPLHNLFGNLLLDGFLVFLDAFLQFKYWRAIKSYLLRMSSLCMEYKDVFTNGYAFDRLEEKKHTQFEQGTKRGRKTVRIGCNDLRQQWSESIVLHFTCCIHSIIWLRMYGVRATDPAYMAQYVYIVQTADMPVRIME